MPAPELIWPYMTVLMMYTKMSSAKAMAEVLQDTSHDRISRMLNGDWSSQTLFEWSLGILFAATGNGWLSLDDTVIIKSYDSGFYEACWCYSSTHRRVVYGVPLVLLVWSNGKVRIPIGYRVYRPGGPSKIELALELLSHARNSLGLKPSCLLFDSWYACHRLLKRVHQYGWLCVFQLRKNRCFNGVPLKDYRGSPYWNEWGMLKGGLKVRVVRHGKKYFGCNRASLCAKQIRKWYKKRQDVEEVFKVLKGELDLEGCQSGYIRDLRGKEVPQQDGPQEHHIAICLVGYMVLEAESQQKETTIRKLRRDLIIRRHEVQMPLFDNLKNAA